MRPTGKEGFLYGVKFGQIIAGGLYAKVPTSGWYKIKRRAAENSGIPGKDPAIERGEALGAGGFYFARKGQPLVAGDALIPMTLHKLSFTTDVSAAAQGQAIDVSTQIDVETGARAYVPSAFKERSGSINGQVDTDSKEQRELVNEFNAVIVDDGAYLTRLPSKTGVHHFMLSRRETRTEGEVEIWEYFPIIVESFQMDKPIDGVCPFNFNYKVDGQSGPGMYYRMVKDEPQDQAGEPQEPAGAVDPEGEPEEDPVENPDPADPGNEPEQGDDE